MKIFVFGSTGMLGNYISTFLSSKYDVVNVSRADIDASQTSSVIISNFLNSKGITKEDIIVNAIGTIKPRVDELGDLNAILVNSVFPHYLAKSAEDLEVKMIHITTDCVFTGNKGSYTESDIHDISDVYGRSKSMGEPLNSTIIRTSIIGEEKNTKRSLVEWIKSNKDKTVFGFTNHLWNGLTCLQVAKVIDEMIQKNIFWKGIRHVHSPRSLDKQQLVQLISNIYSLNINIIPKETEHKCDRSLSTNTPTFDIPDLSIQIQEMKNFQL